MTHEAEVKFKIDDLAAVRRKLRCLGGRYLGTFLQTDSYFDTPERSLLAGDNAVRLRRVRCLRSANGDGDRRPLLTFKGPGLADGEVKIRREVQTRLDNADGIIEILAACGLREFLKVQKRRASYRFQRCLVELDELPLIGSFVEIEASDEKYIRRAWRKLGFDGEPIRQHYIDLLTACCGRVGGDCLDISFDRCAGKCGNADASVAQSR